MLKDRNAPLRGKREAESEPGDEEEVEEITPEEMPQEMYTTAAAGGKKQGISSRDPGGSSDRS